MVASARCIEISTRVNHASHAEHDEHQDRHYEVGNRTLCRCRLLAVLLGTHTMFYDLQFCVNHFIHLTAGALVPFLQTCVVLAHGLEVEARQHDHKYEDDGEESVEIERYSLAEQCQTILAARHETRYGSRPARYGRYDADRSSGRVDEVGELLFCNAMAYGYRTHHRTYCETVEVVVDEDEQTENDSCNLRTYLCLYVFGSPTSESSRSASLVHKRHNGTQNHKKHDDAHVPWVGQAGDKTVLLGVSSRANGVVEQMSQEAFKTCAHRHAV